MFICERCRDKNPQLYRCPMENLRCDINIAHEHCINCRAPNVGPGSSPLLVYIAIQNTDHEGDMILGVGLTLESAKNISENYHIEFEDATPLSWKVVRDNLICSQEFGYFSYEIDIMKVL